MLQRIRGFFGSSLESTQDQSLDHNAVVPYHVAVVMDGNGRWAKKRGLPRTAGHRAGMKVVKNIAIAADEIGIKVLTMYAFSTENWKRPRQEVDFLMRLPEEFLRLELHDLMKHNVQMRFMGALDRLPAYTQETVREAIEQTRSNTGIILNFALNYGGRREITDAIRKLAEDVKEGILLPEEITEESIRSYLLTHDLPDPDLLIRTSGEIRISNFLLWQLAYSELWFTDVYWPDFTREHFYEAIRSFQLRGRRFGGLK
ncbi:isoprenyl transferase [Fodinisporobacter ferrooxydans]|uniref:Isoprenyl transferase n=1 Tax=Fodinisporobacter ferrooxydans TaxID=2901836 RepID=A0ABY4CFT3_9BACL|nr:isoprenyl transferase [Alicyclobacillaceae bacterium MYW30-H2]